VRQDERGGALRLNVQRLTDYLESVYASVQPLKISVAASN